MILRNAAREAATAGMSQRDIARAINRSQPEVSRLLRFSPTSARGRQLAAKRSEVRTALKSAGHRNPRVFGSVAHGTDTPNSDIDLLIDAAPNTDYFDLATMERELSNLVGSRVELAPSDALRPDFRERILAEAAPL